MFNKKKPKKKNKHKPKAPIPAEINFDDLIYDKEADTYYCKECNKTF